MSECYICRKRDVQTANIKNSPATSIDVCIRCCEERICELTKGLISIARIIPHRQTNCVACSVDQKLRALGIFVVRDAATPVA